MKTLVSYDFTRKPPKRFRKTSTRLKKLMKECPRCNGTGVIVPVVVVRENEQVGLKQIRCKWCTTLKEIIIEVKKLETFKMLKHSE